MMLSKGFMVEGLDLSTEMLALAKEMHPNIVFYHADICTWDFPNKYDFISAWDSVWHAPPDEHAGILGKLCNGLSSEGVLIYTSGALDEPSDFCRYVRPYGIICLPCGRKLSCAYGRRDTDYDRTWPFHSFVTKPGYSES